MIRLYRLGVVDRFQPPASGSAPNHYVLDHLGARVVAAQRGIDLRELRWRKEDVEALPWIREFPHLVATNEFFVRIAHACRLEGVHHLTAWWGELRCRRHWEIVLPDGYGRLADSRGSISFFLELDLGTESPGRLAAKLPAYGDVSHAKDCPDVLLFCFPDPIREAAARKRLWAPGMPVATGSWDRYAADPLGAVWLSIGGERRVPLLGLPRRTEGGPP